MSIECNQTSTQLETACSRVGTANHVVFYSSGDSVATTSIKQTSVSSVLFCQKQAGRQRDVPFQHKKQKQHYVYNITLS